MFERSPTLGCHVPVRSDPACRLLPEARFLPRNSAYERQKCSNDWTACKPPNQRDPHLEGSRVTTNYGYQSEQSSLKKQGPSALGVTIPAPGEQVLWKGNIRAEVPQYIFDQVHAAAFHWKCTQISVLLRVLSEHRDIHGKRVFYIRPEDIMADRRKTRKPGADKLSGSKNRVFG